MLQNAPGSQGAGQHECVFSENETTGIRTAEVNSATESAEIYVVFFGGELVEPRGIEPLTSTMPL